MNPRQVSWFWLAPYVPTYLHRASWFLSTLSLLPCFHVLSAVQPRSLLQDGPGTDQYLPSICPVGLDPYYTKIPPKYHQHNTTPRTTTTNRHQSRQDRRNDDRPLLYDIVSQDWRISDGIKKGARGTRPSKNYGIIDKSLSMVPRC